MILITVLVVFADVEILLAIFLIVELGNELENSTGVVYASDHLPETVRLPQKNYHPFLGGESSEFLRNFAVEFAGHLIFSIHKADLDVPHDIEVVGPAKGADDFALEAFGHDLAAAVLVVLALVAFHVEILGALFYC